MFNKSSNAIIYYLENNVLQYKTKIDNDYSTAIDMRTVDSYSVNDDGFLHSFNDEPALVYKEIDNYIFSGTKYWMYNGVSHRFNGPAILSRDGVGSWFNYGSRHRIGGTSSTYNGEDDKDEYYHIHNTLYNKADYESICSYYMEYLFRKLMYD